MDAATNKTHAENPHGIASANLPSEAILDPTIEAGNLTYKAVAEPTNLLLTGATGFVGAFLIPELLHATNAKIHCLVRARSNDEALEKMRRTLVRYEADIRELGHRLVPVLGDLTRPYLGVARRDYDRLANTIEVVYHNGAWSNFVLPYQVLKAANVLGTQEVLRFATTRTLKPVHFVSSAAVYPGHNPKIKFFSEAPLTDGLGVAPGYPQTKWVADKLVTTAGARGVPVAVYRAGQIAGHSRTGACKSELFVCALIKGSIQLGATVDPDIYVELVPIDYVSRAIVHLSRRPDALGKIYNLPNPGTVHWRELVDMTNAFGYPVARLLYHEWYARITDPASDFKNNVLYPYMPLFREDVMVTAHDLSFQVGKPQFDTTNTTVGLANTDIACAPLDADMLGKLFSYLIGIGYLPHPSVRASS